MCFVFVFWQEIRGEICWLGFKTSAQLHLKTLSAQSVLVVRFLLARAGDAVLGLAGARAQAVQSPTILGVINVVLEEKLNRRKDFLHHRTKVATKVNSERRI